VALTRLRQGAPGSVVADDQRAGTDVACDAAAFLQALDRGERDAALDLYEGPFLDGAEPPRLGTELEEWIWTQREFLATQALRARLDRAEAIAIDGDLDAAGEEAASAWAVRGATPEPEDLVRLYTLLLAADRVDAGRVRREAIELGLDPERDLPGNAASARRRLDRRSVRGLVGGERDLPIRSTGFVGREPERAQVADLLDRPGPTITTLAGPPGVGKSRLALQVAHDLHATEARPDGVRFLELAAVDDPGALAAHVAEALGWDGPSSEREALERLATGLRGRAPLLVLDEAEHLAHDASAFARLARAGPDAAWLITSRVRLGLACERIVPVRGLAHPEPGTGRDEGALRFDAVDLFVRRARRLTPGFEPSDDDLPALLRICAQVEGLPLAIELAAAWTRAMPPAQIADELERGIELLSTTAEDVPPRHRSVRAA
ncbi:MAG: AAA family ATPase, partial [Trueperaceae bacterium]